MLYSCHIFGITFRRSIRVYKSGTRYYTYNAQFNLSCNYVKLCNNLIIRYLHVFPVYLILPRKVRLGGQCFMPSLLG